MTDQVTISIVSHGQVNMVNKLLGDISRYCPAARCVVTQNINEGEVVVPGNFDGHVEIIRNARPKGFGANHNQAFHHCDTPYYCVVNPDISFSADPFVGLVKKMDVFNLSIVSPTVLECDGSLADNGRVFPTPWNLAQRLFGVNDGVWPVDGESVYFPDWIGGMFMVFRSADYKALGGFDEKYFMYGEDVDICLRTWRGSKLVAVDIDNFVTHEAQRLSRRNLRYRLWHVRSLMRLWFTHKCQNPRLFG